jgi:hypothetical protein
VAYDGLRRILVNIVAEVGVFHFALGLLVDDRQICDVYLLLNSLTIGVLV